jgi:hypothetical protein
MTGRRIGMVLVVVALGLAYGCSSTPTAGFAPKHEPKTIAIRNASGRAAQSIIVGEDRDATDRPRRVGGVAPAAVNHTYAFARPPDAPPLPATVRVNYSFAGGEPQSTVVDLRPLARQAKGDRDEAVVFELRPGGSVVAYLDHIQP